MSNKMRQARLRRAAEIPKAPLAITESQPHSKILGKCGHCGAEVEAASLRDGRCLTCRVSDAIEVHREEYVRLRRRQNNLRAGGHPTTGCDDQVGRCLRKMWRGITALVPNQTLANTLMQKAMSEFEVAVVSGSGLFMTEETLRKSHPLSKGIVMPSDNRELAPLVAAK